MNNANPLNMLGRMGFYDELGFEKETFTAANVANEVGEVFKDIFALKADIAGVEDKEQSAGFPSSGTIEFNKKQAEIDQKQKKETERKKAFFQALKEDQERARRAKDMLFLEEEINDIAANLPIDQKNELLHYQASYRDRSIYQRAELRKKLIEQRKKQENKEKQAAIPSPAKQANAIETQFEGGSGKYGGGSANLSSASGAVG